VISVAAIIAYGLNPLHVANSAHVSALLVPLAILLFALGSWRAMRHHDRRLCEVCAMSMPLNTAEVAARYRMRFAIVHAVVVKSIVVSYLLVLVGSDIVLLHGTLVERIIWAGIQSTMVYLVLAYSTHRKLQPWCPQCHGGQGEPAQDRGPAPLDNYRR
jgi:hypothetical protein